MLVVVPEPVFPDHASGDRRLAAVLTLLESFADVDLYHESDLEVDGRFGYRPLRGRSWANDFLGLPGTLCRARYKGVFIEFWWVAERTISVARARQPWAACIVDSVDVHFCVSRVPLRSGPWAQRQWHTTKHMSSRFMQPPMR